MNKTKKKKKPRSSSVRHSRRHKFTHKCTLIFGFRDRFAPRQPKTKTKTCKTDDTLVSDLIPKHPNLQIFVFTPKNQTIRTGFFKFGRLGRFGIRRETYVFSSFRDSILGLKLTDRWFGSFWCQVVDPNLYLKSKPMVRSGLNEYSQLSTHNNGPDHFQASQNKYKSKNTRILLQFF